ncbi:MAG: nucleotidyl transferase AbiEii/AbiGii toxin family protein, partial [Candidatus Diapherotrites archaeon]|nr:nucleotidyl transferase AbiEii/AbiGii toxin family protein [Candidatus Diapherotrites archaeon]
GLPLYQQEKDYALKLFLFNYYNQFEEAVFKGGTCIKYLFGLDRFSEDLDFNIRNPKKFRKEVAQVLKQLELLGIKCGIKKEEVFKEAYTAEFSFHGPLFSGSSMTLNKFRIDAGYRFGTLTKPKWSLVASEYPETQKNFLVKAMGEKEMLAEKIGALFERKKGRDLFDAWFLLKKGIQFDQGLFRQKARKAGAKPAIDFSKIVAKKEYERDMEKLTKRVIPYGQIVLDLKEKLK